MKATFFLVLFLLSPTVNETDYDIRKSNWGMSVSEVIESEKPLTPISVREDRVAYENVRIQNYYARIVYLFTNGRLTRVVYTVYDRLNQIEDNRLEMATSLWDKVRYSTDIFNALRQRGYECSLGWYFSRPECTRQTFTRDELVIGGVTENCSLDRSLINRIDDGATKCNSIEIRYGLATDRTRLTITFNQFQNDLRLFDDISNEEDYQMIYRMFFSPSSDVEKDLKKHDF